MKLPIHQFWEHVNDVEAKLPPANALHIVPTRPPAYISVVDRRTAAVRIAEGGFRLATPDEIERHNQRLAVLNGASVARATAAAGKNGILLTRGR